MNARPLTLTVSLADQLFSQTKSVGIFNLSLGLVEQLSRRSELARFTVLANRSLAGRLPPHLDVRWHDGPAGSRLGRLIWDQWGVYSAAAGTGHDWLFLPKGFASFVRACPVRMAACVADTIHDHYRQHHPCAVNRYEQAYFTRSFWAAVRSAQVLFTISDFTTGEVLRLANARGLPPPAVHTMGIGFTPPITPAGAKVNRVCVLSSPFPHKRTELAVQWLARWQGESVFDGEVHWVGRAPAGLAWPAFANWRHHERLPEADYRELLARARVLVFFSEYEGFGMPPVEATLAGACPVYSAIPATREVMGGCGFAFSNQDYPSFRHALSAALQVSGDSLARWGEDLLRRHSWERVADRLLAVLQACNATGGS